MRTPHSLGLCGAAIAGLLALGAPAYAQQTGQPSGTPPSGPSIIVGQNVINEVDDLREATIDLIDAMVNAREGFTVTGWSDAERRLMGVRQELEDMQRTLNEKAVATDQAWSDWMSGGDYGVTVREQVNRIGQYLTGMAETLESFKQEQSGVPIVVGEKLVRKVDDVRASVADLVDALDRASEQFGQGAERQRFEQARSRLAEMGEALAAKAKEADHEWATFIASPEFRTSIHEDLKTLGEMVQNLLPEGA